jgi:hypothetical protein
MGSIKIGGYKKTNRSSFPSCVLVLHRQLFGQQDRKVRKGARHGIPFFPLSFFSAFYLLWKGTGRGRQQREKELNYYMRHALALRY